MYPNNLIKLTWGGDVRGDDVWSNGVHFMSPTGDADTATAFNSWNLLDTWTPMITAYTGTSGISSYNNIGWMKLALIGRDGKYIADPVLFEPANPVAGTNAASGRAPQDTFVVSLTTAEKRGLAHRGRIYPPSGFSALGADGLLPGANATTYSTKFKTMFNAFINNLQPGLPAIDLVIASKERAGKTNKVTGLSVGNLLDTQNRRRNKLSEIYTNTNL